MALSTAAAILGSAVIGAGASAITGSKAASKAVDASQYATDQNALLQREAMQIAQQNTTTSRAAGDLSTNALAARFGLIPTGSTLSGNIYAAGAGAQPQASGGATPNIYGSSVPYSASQQGGQPDWNAVLAARPDVAAAVNAPNSYFSGSTPQERAADWYARYGEASGYQLPTISAQQGTEPQTYDVQLSSAAQVPTYTRPAAQQAPGAYVPNVYTPQTFTAPTYDRPAYDKTLDVSYDAYEASPEALAAQYDIDQQSGAASSALAAAGGLKSGAALKALQKIGQDNKVKYYSDFRNYNTNQYNTDRARADNIYNYDTSMKANLAQAYDALNSNNAFNYAGLNSNNALQAAQLARSDYQYGQNRDDNIYNLDRAYGTDLALNNRAYETGRYDTQTGNLFNLANLGQGASAQSTSAAQNYANNTGNALFSNAANQGNAALASAAQFNSALGSGLSALGYALGNRSNSAAATTTPKAATNIYALGGGY